MSSGSGEIRQRDTYPPFLRQVEFVRETHIRPFCVRWNSPERHISALVRHIFVWLRTNLSPELWLRRLPALLQLFLPDSVPRARLQPVPSSLRTAQSLHRGVLRIPDRCSLC